MECPAVSFLKHVRECIKKTADGHSFYINRACESDKNQIY